VTLGLVLIDSDMRARLAELHIQELIAEAERVRLARSARPPQPLLRVRALRLAARGLRVEREIDFESARMLRRGARVLAASRPACPLNETRSTRAR
jgi:hypothetical protein